MGLESPMKNGQGLQTDWVQTRKDSGGGEGREAVVISRKPPLRKSTRGEGRKELASLPAASLLIG